ncbi:endonuclease/exonuclease/phosphatase family protein [Mycolicibacterium neoaurum]|nr:endonuclease/exonuclease/phosphatase family protein [Mycolicibacterium neoaurum]TLH59406.1 endonuclease/exonuclease/phosphatase family protein [Mycolicibacterium neoaurum]
MAFALSALVYAVIAVLIRALPLSNLPALLAVVSLPYVPFGVLAAVLMLSLCRRVFLVLAASAILAITIAVQFPWYFGGHTADTDQHLTIRVLSSNLRYGQADPAFFVELANTSADVITVSELTAEAVDKFNQAGLGRTFPYASLTPRPGAGGIGLWSRYPIAPLSSSKYESNSAAARLTIPGVQQDPIVSSVHLMSPIAGDENTFADWNRKITAARSEFAAYAEAAGPAAVIIAGDFNSTVDMRQFRDLLDVGYQEAVRQTGAGFGPTYSPHPRIPPLITIDHVLTRNSTAMSIHTVDVPGSDHRALLATVALPVNPDNP